MPSYLSLFSIKILRPILLWHALSNALYNARASFLIWEAEGNEENVSDILTKALSNEKFHYLLKRWFFRVPEKDK
jgi:hypothetical protein